MEATWVRIGDVGQATLWQCSACKMIMELRGIYTPYGLGNTECPECGVKIINVNQNVHT